MTTCKTCIFHDEINDLTFYCDHFGVCSADDLRPCELYVPTDNTKEEEGEE